MNLRIRTLDGGSTTVTGDDVAALEASFDGTLITPESATYDEARAIWNGMIDRRPALIGRCANAGDVSELVRFANAHNLLTAVRSGGHNIAGSATCDSGLVIDLSALTNVDVDAEQRTARVEPGCSLADVDAATQKHGLAVPVGINSTTGIAGLTLGGGFGWLSRKHGLTVDSLRAVDIVTADGELRRASAHENPDLFWAVRGGGGNFGVVTRFDFQLHPVGPEVLSGLIVHPFDDAADVLRAWRDFCRTAPDELTVWVVLRKAPPLPFLPEEWHGREVVVLAACWVGPDSAAGERALHSLRAFGKPIADVIGPHPFAGWQQAFDPLLTPGARNYWKSHSFHALSDDALDTFREVASQLPDPQCEIFLAQMGGATNRVPTDATAYADRSAGFIMNVHARWTDAALDSTCIGWARDVFRKTAPFASGNVYVNFMTGDEAERVKNAYGANYKRLAQIKQAWDPDNRFRVNQNVSTGSAAAPTGAGD